MTLMNSIMKEQHSEIPNTISCHTGVSSGGIPSCNVNDCYEWTTARSLSRLTTSRPNAQENMSVFEIITELTLWNGNN